MKKIIYFIVCSIFLLIAITQKTSFSQEWEGIKPNGFWDHWSINLNAGITSYFGDLSYYDSDFAGKISNESGPAFGATLTKHFSSKFGLSGQLLYGNFGGGNNSSNSFDTKVFEYNLHLRLDFLRLLLSSNKNPKFGIEGFAGLGHLWFNVAHFEYYEGNTISNEFKSSSPELVYFAGIGVHYHVAEKIAITASMSLKQIQNDKMDNLVKNDDFDLFTYFNIGFTYYFSGRGTKFVKKKGSRLADSGIRGF